MNPVYHKLQRRLKHLGLFKEVFSTDKWWCVRCGTYHNKWGSGLCQQCIDTANLEIENVKASYVEDIEVNQLPNIEDTKEEDDD